MAEAKPVTDAIDMLAGARTPSELAASHRSLLHSVRAARRKLAPHLGRLARAYTEAMDIMDTQRDAGVPFEERVKGLDGVLRQFWPQGRVWHYLCDRCDDTGLVMRVCRRGARCNGISTRTDGGMRMCAKDPDGEHEHDYGTACVCDKGLRFRQRPKPGPEDFTAAGQSKDFKRAGRR